MRTRLKVCCISSMNEAEMAITHGADAIGLLGDMPTSPRSIDIELARKIAEKAPSTIETFLLTSRLSGHQIADKVEYCGTTAVQVVQHIDAHEYQALIDRIPSVRRVQAIHVEDESVLDLIDVYDPFVHAFILDSGTATGNIARLGGTGQTHDWRISSEFVRQSAKPVFLAGGLNSGNARKAIKTVSPYGLDVCTGVRRQNQLDPHLLREFTVRLRTDVPNTSG